MPYLLLKFFYALILQPLEILVVSLLLLFNVLFEGKKKHFIRNIIQDTRGIFNPRLFTFCVIGITEDRLAANTILSRSLTYNLHD